MGKQTKPGFLDSLFRVSKSRYETHHPSSGCGNALKFICLFPVYLVLWALNLVASLIRIDLYTSMLFGDDTHDMIQSRYRLRFLEQCDLKGKMNKVARKMSK